jgi:hypothetical protein
MQLFVILGRLEAERIEIGMQVTAHAVGADHHQRAHAVAGGAQDVGGGNLDALLLPLGLELVGHDLLDGAPVAVERGNEVALGVDRPVGLFP